MAATATKIPLRTSKQSLTVVLTMPVKRSDLCVSYKHVAPPKSPYAATSNITGLVNQSTPMMAMFLKNKFMAWFAVVQSFHSYLNFRSDDAVSGNSNSLDQSPGLRLLMSMIGLVVCYMDLVFPTPPAPTPASAPAASESPKDAEETSQ
ncbi:YPR063C [Zygosaccharomyces parabailii]|nr:YPR063C [Zygosaccharomyces parabailii]CDH08605.1 uncharacterized protein ZBAI_00387 [Zygosaccharomyces bailii ISA1307]